MRTTPLLTAKKPKTHERSAKYVPEPYMPFTLPSLAKTVIHENPNPNVSA